jgi:hypothetical protein
MRLSRAISFGALLAAAALGATERKPWRASENPMS